MIDFHLLFISCILHNFYQGLEPNLNINHLNINHLISNHLSNHRVFSVTTIEDISRTNHTAEDTLLTNNTAVADGTLITNHTAEEASADGSIQCISQSSATISIFASKHSFFGVSSNIILELQPFFPLHKEMVRLLKKSYEHYHSSTYTAAMSPQRNRLNQTENETAVGMMPAPIMSCA
jgi:hypothetical protein